MRSTIRFRLTVWYLVVLAAILVVFSLGVYSLAAKNLLQRLDGNLRSAVQVTALSLNHEIEEHGGKAEGEKSSREVLNTMHQTSFPRVGISIWEGTRLVAGKPGLAAASASDVGSLSSINPEDLDETMSIQGKQYRVHATDVFVASANSRYRVVANESIEAIDAELRTLQEILLFIVPACLLLAAAGGYFLAKKSVAPVLAMARTAEQIGSYNLDQRLPVANPNDELGLLADTFNRLFARLQEAFLQQRQFMTDASHELRTPLSVALIATQVNLHKRTNDLGEVYETLDVVQAQLLRLRRVVEDMFTLAQAETGVYQPMVTTFYLDEVITESVKAARILGSGRQIRIKTDLSIPELAYRGDEGLLRQLFLILLDNAVKYSPIYGEIAVSLSRHQQNYLITVADQGSGIPESAQPRIFDRFYRVDKSRSRNEQGAGGGAGLGLAIARWIAQLHEGRITLEHSTAQGSVFAVHLPISRTIGQEVIDSVETARGRNPGYVVSDTFQPQQIKQHWRNQQRKN